jgi:hypothetical protein
MAEKNLEEKLDAEVADSFPASDAPSNTPVGGTKKSRELDEAHAHGHDVPRGMPSDDRHATETAGAITHGVHPAETDERSGES